MDRYAINERTISDAVKGGGLLVVAQWEASEGQADKVAGILRRFLPEAQSEPGAKLFLIGQAQENPAQFLFYELFRDEAAFKAHQESAHFKTHIAGEALPLLARRERVQYALL
jgi:quinol monooxygenase YgiN